MTITKTANGMTKLVADDGYKIVYNNDLSTAAEICYLGIGDDPKYYSEYSDEIIEAYQVEQEAQANGESEANAGIATISELDGADAGATTGNGTCPTCGRSY